MRAEDLGLGELYPSSGKIWEANISLPEKGRKGGMMAMYQLCRAKAAKHPFYIESIDINIYTIEELCFISGRM